MPAPKKKKPEDKVEKKSSSTKNKLQISVAVPSLSSLDENEAAQVISEVKANIYNSINNAELQRALDKWVRENHSENKIQTRDYNILKSIITEYLDSYILIGYSDKGERYIVQHAESARDRDAIMEFLKTVFIQQQQNNFLEAENDDDDQLD